MSLRWRLLLVFGLVGLLGFTGLSNFADEDARKASGLLPDEGLRLGLDHQGGIHMVVGPDLDVAIGHELSAIRGSLIEDAEEEGFVDLSALVDGDVLRVKPSSVDALEAVRGILEDYDSVSVGDGADEYELALTLNPDVVATVRERAMAQALEVLRRRVDDPQTGIPESVITRQGRERILVEIPGVSRVPDIFRRTGFLEFKIVQDVADTTELLLAKYASGLPDGTEIQIERDRETKREIRAYLLPQEADITGDRLSDARVGFDSRVNEWEVQFTWDAEGARIFGDLTEKNVGNGLAIIMDKEVYSAPSIESRISRSGRITGNFSSQDASDLAVILRAGALPIPVEIEEERTVGPALGADSIRRGVFAALAGLGVVAIFMLGYYKLSGGYASLALLANLLCIMGLMSLFEGTLTLPGLAGLVLTVGMAVDANVIIFERIREELRSGRSPRASIAAGFQKARWTILDANITTLITAIVLFEYGTGPIKGFAVTLSVGIVTSVFAALVITRLFYDIKPGQQNVAELSI